MTLDHTSHIICRKAYTSHYTPSNLAPFQSEIHDFTLELVNMHISTTPHSFLVPFGTQALDEISCRCLLIVLVSFIGVVYMCLNVLAGLFRHLMVDVVVASSHGYHLCAVRNGLRTSTMNSPSLSTTFRSVESSYVPFRQNSSIRSLMLVATYIA